MIEHPLILLLAFPAAAYFIGAIPFGVIIARAHHVDLRKTGSGNVGATNVGRVLGRPWGYLCFFLDVAKGVVPVMLLAHWILASASIPTPLHQAALLATAFGAILGHVFSFWLRFRGGKGVATALGVVLGVYPYFTFAGLAALALWIAVTLTTRYVSVGSIAAALAFAPLFVAFNFRHIGHLWPLGTFALLMVALIIFRHRGNIRRLLAGQENKIRSKGA